MFFLFSSSGERSGDFSKSSGDFPQSFLCYLGELYLSHENNFLNGSKAENLRSLCFRAINIGCTHPRIGEI